MKTDIMKYTEKISNELNELLTRNYDAEAGYKMAADRVENPELKKFFNERAKDRYDFGHQLKNEIVSYGETPDKGTSFKGDMHRTWMNLKTALSSNNEEVLLEEAIRGEKEFIETYNELLQEENLAPTTESLIKVQRDSVQNTLREIKIFETVA
ncbi:ferritin-like domain-containing protein [Croceiramulus getboli]|nr:PA2169 family four-helix-bundle protein [Flavobacteriaceae bacterium YJPT1-3]